MLEAARQSGAEAVHPGYGFLAEDAGFARRVRDAGLVWVGPSPEAIEAMGDKIRARNLVAAAGVPVSRGTSEPVGDAEQAVAAARDIGFPVMVKASAGGGGMGMAVAADEAALRTELERVRGFAERMFGDPAVLLERFFPRVRHVEVQVLGLADGRVVALGERDCSVQRRNQKLAEETPSPAVTPALRDQLFRGGDRRGRGRRLPQRRHGRVPARRRLRRVRLPRDEHPAAGRAPGHRDGDRHRPGRAAAAHRRRAAGLASTPTRCRPTGHALELRVNAEDPVRFLPGPGAITVWEEPTGPGVRVDSGYAAGTTVTPHYDSLMAKLIVHGADREQALERARAAVAAFRVEGPKCNLPFFAELLDNPEFVSGEYDTGIVGRMRA